MRSSRAHRAIGARDRVPDIDGLRAIAVLAVLAFHVASADPHSAHPLWLQCGARGVELFFVVSGFCLSYPYLAALRDGRRPVFDCGRFAAKRLVRIVPPYLAALTLFLFLSTTPFGLPTSNSIHFSPPEALRAYVLDALFLTSKIPAFNGSFWTIGLEMRWYLVFPLVLALYVRSRTAVFALLAAAYAWTFGTPWYVETVAALPAFVLGIVAADVRIANPPLRRLALPLALALAVPAVRLQAFDPHANPGDPLWHALAFLLAVAGGDGVTARVLTWRPMRALGIASFSIYLVHQPIAQSLESAGVAPFASALAALACGFAFFALVERPATSPRFRTFAESRILRVWNAAFHRGSGEAPDLVRT